MYTKPKMSYSQVIRAKNAFHRRRMTKADCPSSAADVYDWLINQFNSYFWEETSLAISDRSLGTYLNLSHGSVNNARHWLANNGYITYEEINKITHYRLVFFDNYLANLLPTVSQELANRLPISPDKARQDAIGDYSSRPRVKIQMIDEREAGMGELREDSENGKGLIAEEDANASEARIPDTSYATSSQVASATLNRTVKEETYSGMNPTASQYPSATKDTDNLSAEEYSQLELKALKANVSLEDRVFQPGTYEYFKAHLTIRELNTLATFETPENIEHLKEVYEANWEGMGCPLAYLRTTAQRYNAAQATKRKKQAERAAKLADRAGSSAPKASDKPPHCSDILWETFGRMAEGACSPNAKPRETEFERDLRNMRDMWIPTSDKRDNYAREEHRHVKFPQYYTCNYKAFEKPHMRSAAEVAAANDPKHVRLPEKGTAARRYWNWVYRDEETSDPQDAACRALWRVWKEGEPVPPLKYDEPAQIADNVSITADSIADSEVSITADSIADSEVSITADSIADSEVSITADSIADSDISITAADYDMVVEPDFSNVKDAFLDTISAEQFKRAKAVAAKYGLPDPEEFVDPAQINADNVYTIDDAAKLGDSLPNGAIISTQPSAKELAEGYSKFMAAKYAEQSNDDYDDDYDEEICAESTSETIEPAQASVNETNDAAQVITVETNEPAQVITVETNDAAQVITVETNEPAQVITVETNEPAQVPTAATISPYSSTNEISYARVKYNYRYYDKPVDNPIDAQIREVFKTRQAEFDAAKPHAFIDDLTKDSAQECKTFIERLMYNSKHCYEPTDNPYDLYQRLICQQSKAKIAEEKRIAEEERKRREAADAAWKAKLAEMHKRCGDPVKKTETPKRPVSTPTDEDYFAAKEAEEAAKTPEEREAEIIRRVMISRAEDGDEEARVKVLTEILIIPGADAPYRERFLVAQHRENFIRYKREDYEIVEQADRTIEFRKGSALASINKGKKSEVYLCDGYKVIYPDGKIEDFTDAEKHAI